MNKLAITIYGSKAYDYAIRTLVQKIAAQRDLDKYELHLIWVGCDSEQHKQNCLDVCNALLPEGIALTYASAGPAPDLSKVKAYKEEAQMYIARMQGIGFAIAKRWGADYCWSVEADVLPPHNALSCMMDMLSFDDGYYDVAMVTYPDQSGGSFLGGNGTPTRQIEEDWKIEERNIPARLKLCIEEREKRAKTGDEKSAKKLHKLLKKAEEYPPKGNVFELNAKGWRRRGWLQNAYPGVGRGAVLPTDWTGMGCILMSKKALGFADFTGYLGGGTQDLFINWNCWHPNNIRMCVITHIACAHVIRKRNEDQTQDFKQLTLVQPYHEAEGEYKGHLRLRHIPWPSESFNI